MIRFTTALALVTIAVAVPTAQAEPSFGRSIPLDPAIAAAVQTHSLASGPHHLTHAPAVQTHRLAYGPHHLPGPLDPAIAAAIEQRGSETQPQSAATSGFDWSDFTVGAGVMLGFVFALGSLLIIKSRQSARLGV
jgi:hypothetical protein